MPEEKEEFISEEEYKTLLDENPKIKRATMNMAGTIQKMQELENDTAPARAKGLEVPGIEQSIEKCHMNIARAFDEIGKTFDLLEGHKDAEKLQAILLSAHQNGAMYFQAIFYGLHVGRMHAQSGGDRMHMRLMQEAYALVKRAKSL